MKKILVSLLAVVMVLTLSVSVFAAGNFISSPSFQAGPQLLGATFIGDCKATLQLVPYSERNTLSAEDQALIEKAYKQIADCEDLKNLFAGIQIPAGMQHLAVSDLFFITYEGCDDHAGHTFTATIKPEIIKNLAGVYVMVNGEWIAVEYKVDGQNLVITSNYSGPYAIVTGVDSVPGTGDSFPWGYLVAMVVSAVGLVVIAFAFKKKVA